MPSSTSRAASVSSAYRSVRSAKRTPKVRRAGASVPGSLDLATKLRQSKSGSRNVAERRETLLEMLRAVNATLEPERVAELLIERAALWLPVPYWAVVSADLSAQL